MVSLTHCTHISFVFFVYSNTLRVVPTCSSSYIILHSHTFLFCLLAYLLWERFFVLSPVFSTCFNSHVAVSRRFPEFLSRFLFYHRRILCVEFWQKRHHRHVFSSIYHIVCRQFKPVFLFHLCLPRAWVTPHQKTLNDLTRREFHLFVRTTWSLALLLKIFTVRFASPCQLSPFHESSRGCLLVFSPIFNLCSCSWKLLFLFLLNINLPRGFCVVLSVLF